MEITASMVKDLREKTGAGMMDCKKALVETNGDMDKAIDYLREKGISKAAKKAERIAAEGLSNIYVEGNNAVVIELNSETDFVAKNAEFKELLDTIGNTILASDVETLEDALNLETANGTINDLVVAATAKIGEKISLRRFEKVTTEGQIAGYIHGGGKIGVLVELLTSAKSDELIAMGRDIAMQVAAMNPKYVSRNDVDPEYIAHETEILTQQALNEGKPANIVEKMIKGRLEKQLKEVCLLEQPFVKNGDLTVKQLVAETAKKLGTEIEVGRVVRFEVCEGIEK